MTSLMASTSTPAALTAAPRRQRVTTDSALALVTQLSRTTTTPTEAADAARTLVRLLDAATGTTAPPESPDDAIDVAALHVAPARLATLCLQALFASPTADNCESLLVADSPAHLALAARCFRAAPLADVAGCVRAMCAGSVPVDFDLLAQVAPRCDTPQLLLLLLRAALLRAPSDLANLLVARAVRTLVANARTKSELLVSQVLAPLLAADEPPSRALVARLRLVLPEVVADASASASTKLIATLTANPKQSIGRALLAATLALRDAPAALAPALFSALVGLPQLEHQLALSPLAPRDETAVMRNGATLAEHAKAVTALARELLDAVLAALAAAADDAVRADRCVDAIADIVSRVALSGTYLPNGALDDDIERAAAAALAARAVSLDCKGDFFAVLLSVNVRFVLARRRALLAALWSSGDALARREPVVVAAGAAEARGAKAFLVALVDASARARQLPEFLDDALHCFEHVPCRGGGGGGASLFDDEWLDSVLRAYRASAPAQITEILTKARATFRDGAFFALDAPAHGAEAARGFAVGWRLFANVLVGAVHVSPTRRDEVHAELASMWTEWLAPVVRARTAAECDAASARERVVALCVVCVQLACALERCELLLESGGGDEDDLHDATATADAPMLAAELAATLAHSAVVEWLGGQLADASDEDAEIAHALIRLWALLTRVAPELEGVVSVRACLESRAESVWRVAVHSIRALAQRTDSTELVALLVGAALPAAPHGHKEKRKRRSAAAATTTPPRRSAVCAAALEQDYVYQLFDLGEPLCRALVERLALAVANDSEYAGVAERVQRLADNGADADAIAAQLTAAVAPADGDASSESDVVAVLRQMARVPALFWPRPLAVRAAGIALLVRLLFPTHDAARALLAALPTHAVCVALTAPGAMSVLLDDSALLMRLCEQLCERVVVRSTREASAATLQTLVALVARGDAAALSLAHCAAAAVRAVPKARAHTRALCDAINGAVLRAVESDSAADESLLCRAMAEALLVGEGDALASLIGAASALVARMMAVPDRVSPTALAALSLALMRVSPADEQTRVSPAAKHAVSLLLRTTYDQDQLLPLLRSKPLRPTLRYLVRLLVRGVGQRRRDLAAGSAAQAFLLEVLLDIGYVNRASLLRGGIKGPLLQAVDALCVELVAAGELAACAAPLKCLETLVADDTVALTTWELAAILRCANLVASTSAPAAHATMELACRVGGAVLRRRDSATEHLGGMVCVLLRALTARVFDASAGATAANASAVLALTDAFVRALSAMASTDNRKLYMRGVAYLASDYLGWLERVAVRDEECRTLLSRGLWHLFDVCSASHFKVIYETASAIGKQLFRQQRERYTAEHKFTGVV
jgi:hypothetical protein